MAAEGTSDPAGEPSDRSAGIGGALASEVKKGGYPTASTRIIQGL